MAFAVSGKQSEEGWGQHTALWSSSVEDYRGELLVVEEKQRSTSKILNKRVMSYYTTVKTP